MSGAVDAAQAAAEAVRDLNRSTLGGGYEYPSQVYEVLGALVTMAARLPQALGQAGAWLEAEHDAGRVGHDQGANLTLSVYPALTSMDDAVRHARALARALGAAYEHTGHLTGVGL